MPEESSRRDKEVPQDRVVRNIRIGLAISMSVLLSYLLVAGLWSFVSPTMPTERKDLVQAVGVLLAAIAALVGIFLTAQNVRTNQRTLRANLENTQRTLELTEQGQITERFTHAIEQLGATTDGKEGKPKLDIRLGGIYALERIAKDSSRSKVDPGRDYSSVMEVLTAYIRQNAPLPPKESTEPTSMLPEAVEQSGKAEQQSEGTQQNSALAPQEEPRADIQAVLDVLRRREEDNVPDEYHVLLDLSKTKLFRANLQRAYLRGAILEGANLQEAIFQEANLQGANLRGAKLLTQEQLEQASGDKNTILPKGLERPKSWTQDEHKQADENEQA